jgi:hypothetical protein
MRGRASTLPTRAISAAMPASIGGMIWAPLPQYTL